MLIFTAQFLIRWCCVVTVKESLQNYNWKGTCNLEKYAIFGLKVLNNGCARE